MKLLIFLLLTTCYLLLATPTLAVTQEEISVYNIGNGTLPPSIVGESPRDAGGIKGFFDGIGDLFSKAFFNPPEDKTKYYTQAERVSGGETPPQLKPEGENFFDNLQKFVAKNTGFYGNYLPEFQKPPEDIKGYEVAFEDSYFPQQINPITGDQVTNTTPSSSTQTNTSPSGTSTSPTSTSQTDLETRMIEMVNEDRRKAGVGDLTFDPSLLPLARDMAVELPNMYLNNTLFYSHTNRAGEDLTKRAARLNIPKDATLFENLAFAPTFEGVFQELLKSKPHRDNMRREGITRVAIGVHQQGNMVFVAQEFK